MCTYDWGDFLALFLILAFTFIGGWASGWNSGKKEGYEAGYRRGRNFARPPRMENDR